MSQGNVQNQPCLQFFVLLTEGDCRKVVHEQYAPNEIRQVFLFVAMTYALGSLAFKHVMRI